MAGLLELILSNFKQPPLATMGQGGLPWDEEAMAEEARLAAARRVAGKRTMNSPMAPIPVQVPGDEPWDEPAQADAARVAAAGRVGVRNPVGGEQPVMPGMGMLAGLLSGQQGPGVGSYPFATPPAANWGPQGPAVDESAAAQDALTTAAGRTARSLRRPGVFDRGTDAIPGIDAVAGMLSTGGNGGGPGLSRTPILPGEFDRPPTNDPMSGEPQQVSDVPLPRPRPNGIGDDPGVAPLSMAPTVPAEAQPTQGQAPPGFNVQGGGGGPSLFERIFDPNKAATWMAMASGFAGAPTVGIGVGRAAGAAVPAMVADRAAATKQQSQASTFRALVAQGVPPHIALAASQNGDVMKAVATKYFEGKSRVPHKIGVDWLGNDVMGSFDPNTGKYFDTAGKEVTSGAGSPGSTGQPGGMQMLAKGVTEYSPELPGDEYLNQFSPEVKAAIQSYVRGDTMPTGNPRLKGLDGKVKEWARLYGDKTGIVVSDATFAERKKFRTELGSASASTVGGQSKAFNQGIEHAEALAKKMEQLGNVDPLGIPTVGYGLNWMRQKFSSKQQSVANEAAAIGQTLAGEVGKLFSGSQGGGVHERELTRQRFNTISTPAELGAALEATLETMEGGLRALEQRRDATMGPNSGIVLVPPETHHKINEIRQVIARLRGDAPAQAPAAGPGAAAPPPGNYVFDPATKRLVPAK